MSESQLKCSEKMSSIEISPCGRSNNQLICLEKTGMHMEKGTLWIFKSDPKLCLIYSILSWSNKQWQFDPSCSILLTFYAQRHRYRAARKGLELVGGLIIAIGAGPTQSEFPLGSKTPRSVLKRLIPVSNRKEDIQEVRDEMEARWPGLPGSGDDPAA